MITIITRTVNKPIRHNNHILETESNKFFNNIIPHEWYTDKPEHDYGLDYNVNIAINNQVTGLNFSVQLKSKQICDNEKYVPIILKRSTLGLFQARLEPILLVVYVQGDKEAYWYWYNELTIDLTVKQETFSINIPKSNKLSFIDWDEIIKYVQNIFSLKSLIDGIRLLEYKEFTESETLAWKYYYSENYENAIFYFKNTLKEKPGNITITEALTHSLYMSHNYNEALFHINKLIEISGTDNQYLLKASILTEDGILNNIKGKILEGRNIFKKFIDKNSNHSYYQYNYANALSRLDEYQEAIKHYNICLKINPNHAQAWKNLGSVYNQLHLYDKVLLCYDKALMLDPHLPQALFSKGITLSQIYDKHQEGLNLMEKALIHEAEMLQSYPHAYFWLAFSNEKLSNLREALKWINKGLDHYPEDVYFLDFKTRLFISHWENNDWLKEEAISYFEYRIELDNDYRSLYYLTKIKKMSNDTTYTFLREHIPIFENISKKDISEYNLNICSLTLFLLHYDKYQKFREKHPIDRYINHIASPYYAVSTEFWDLLDLVFAYSFSNHVEKYYENKIEQMGSALLKGLILSTNILPSMFENETFTQDESISILAHIYIEYPKVILREYGAQSGHVAVNLDLIKPNPEKDISEQWDEELREKILIEINSKLKLLKD